VSLQVFRALRRYYARPVFTTQPWVETLLTLALAQNKGRLSDEDEQAYPHT
jgi:hypothetical protein